MFHVTYSVVYTIRKSGGDKSSYDFFLPMYSLLTTNSALTSERVNIYIYI